MHPWGRSPSKREDTPSKQPSSMSYYAVSHTYDQGQRSGSHSYSHSTHSANAPPSDRNSSQPRKFSGSPYDSSNAVGMSIDTSYNGYLPQSPISTQDTQFHSRNGPNPQFEYSHDHFGTSAPFQSQNAYESRHHNIMSSYYGISSNTATSPHGRAPNVSSGLPRGASSGRPMSQPRIPQFPVGDLRNSGHRDTNRMHGTHMFHPLSLCTHLAPSMSPHAQYHDNTPSPTPSESPTGSVTILSPSPSIGHEIREIPITGQERSRYIRYPTAAESASTGWRHGNYKCTYEGCASSAVEPNKISNHLALHIHSKKAFECTCGARFGRLSEANRHLEDQSPCEKCQESRRKHKGTRICARCIGNTSRGG